MKRVARWRYLTIGKKLSGDVCITFDDRTLYSYEFSEGRGDNIIINPFITIDIMRPKEENGIRLMKDIKDSLSLTRYNFPIFVRELEKVQKDMVDKKELYSYVASQLELNDEIALSIRRAFPIANNVVEIIPVVIIQDDTRMEGVKIKFNNEDHVVYLNIDELYSLYYILSHLDIDSLCLTMFNEFRKTSKNH